MNNINEIIAALQNLEFTAPNGVYDFFDDGRQRGLQEVIPIVASFISQERLRKIFCLGSDYEVKYIDCSGGYNPYGQFSGGCISFRCEGDGLCETEEMLREQGVIFDALPSDDAFTLLLIKLLKKLPSHLFPRLFRFNFEDETICPSRYHFIRGNQVRFSREGEFRENVSAQGDWIYWEEGIYDVVDCYTAKGIRGDLSTLNEETWEFEI